MQSKIKVKSLSNNLYAKTIHWTVISPRKVTFYGYKAACLRRKKPKEALQLYFCNNQNNVTVLWSHGQWLEGHSHKTLKKKKPNKLKFCPYICILKRGCKFLIKAWCDMGCHSYQCLLENMKQAWESPRSLLTCRVQITLSGLSSFYCVFYQWCWMFL